MANDYQSENVTDNEQRKFQPDTAGNTAVNVISVNLETKLQLIIDAVDGLEGFTDGLEPLITATNALMTTIRDNADQLEGYTDGLEGLITSTNSLLTTIRDNADQVEGFLDDVETRLGVVTETAPASDTASSGLNGRLQRIAQRLTSLITATTDRTQFTNITDGTNDGTIKASNIPPTKSDTSLVIVNAPFNYRHIQAATTTVVKSGAGVLSSIIITTIGNGIFTVYDNTAGSGTIIALITSTNIITPSGINFNIEFNTGLTIVSSSANPAITVVYK